MKTHFLQEHRTCNIQNCGKTFKTSNELDMHIIYKHNETRPFSCKFCEKRFKTKRNLLDHTRTHTNERPFSCSHPNCGKRFKQKSVLNDHMSIHIKIRKDNLFVNKGKHHFECPECKKSFKSGRLRRRHVLRMHGGNRKQFPCLVPHCPKVFITNVGLTLHRKSIHEGVFPFPCKICGRAFAQKEMLTRHIRIHTKEKPFSCYFCQQKFSGGGSIFSHIRIHTSKLNKPLKTDVSK